MNLESRCYHIPTTLYCLILLRYIISFRNVSIKTSMCRILTNSTVQPAVCIYVSHVNGKRITNAKKVANVQHSQLFSVGWLHHVNVCVRVCKLRRSLSPFWFVDGRDDILETRKTAAKQAPKAVKRKITFFTPPDYMHAYSEKQVTCT